MGRLESNKGDPDYLFSLENHSALKNTKAKDYNPLHNIPGTVANIESKDTDTEKDSSKGRIEERKAPATQVMPGHTEVMRPFIREEASARKGEAEKVKLLALLKGIREEMNQPLKKGKMQREQTDMFIERYNFFLVRTSMLFPDTDFTEIFVPLETGAASIEKIRLELTMMIAYIQNDIMDLIEQTQRLKEKNKWLQDRIREFELKIAGIQSIK
jgi:hypothetical protein